MAAELVSLTSEANVSRRCGMLWGSLAPGSSRVSSCCLRHACVLLSILFIFGCEWLNSLVRKDKVFSSVNKGGVVFMLRSLLRCSRKATLPLETACSAETCWDGSKTWILGIKFMPSVYKDWFLESFTGDMSLILCSWIRPEKWLHYACCTAVWIDSKTLRWSMVGTWVPLWLRGWSPCTKGLAVLGGDPHEQAEVLQPGATSCLWCAPALHQATSI